MYDKKLLDFRQQNRNKKDSSFKIKINKIIIQLKRFKLKIIGSLKLKFDDRFF